MQWHGNRILFDTGRQTTHEYAGSSHKQAKDTDEKFLLVRFLPYKYEDEQRKGYKDGDGSFCVKSDWIGVSSALIFVLVFTVILIPKAPGLKSFKSDDNACKEQNEAGEIELKIGYTYVFQVTQKYAAKKAGDAQ